MRQAILRETVAANPFIPQIPTPPQARFLSLLGREALFGGAAGGGKSSALLMAALQFVEQPGYSAIIFRRTFADLNLPGALMARAKEWLTGKAHWNAQEHRWTFPSGATLQFGYLEHEDQKYRYQSAEFQFIGFDEAGQFSETQCRYLYSRLRRLQTSAIPLRFRLASNPGGRGHAWLKRDYVRGPKTFIPSLLDDNPHLDRESYVQSLNELDPVTRDQLLRGDWDAAEDGRFKREWLRFYTRYGTGYVLKHAGNGRDVTAQQVSTRFLTVDAAASVKATAKADPDFTVISGWGLAGPDLLWLGCMPLRVEGPDIPRHVAGEYARWRCSAVYIEGGGMQKTIPQLVRRHGPPYMNVIETSAKGDKLEKAATALNLAAAGRIWLPADGAADGYFPLEEVMTQLTRFTGVDSGHDDIWDTFGIAGRVADGKIARIGSSAPSIM